jgi:serine/threonine protein phosphatase PrpC
MIANFFYHNERYTLPREDATALDAERGLFVAADGVTRDFGGVLQGLMPYPDPSPATDAADAVAETALETLRDCPGTEDCVRQALQAANEAVGDVNTDLGLWEKCDYLECDLAGAVAAVSMVREDTLTIGWIGDCGVAVVRDGRLAYLTRDQLDHLLGHLAANPATYDDARRVYIRGTLRNRPDTLHEGKPITYGVLTGEPEAARYIETVTLPLRPGDVVATHTDGFRPYFEAPEFLAVLSGDPARWEEDVPVVMRRLIDVNPEYGKERSLILYKHENPRD